MTQDTQSYSWKKPFFTAAIAMFFLLLINDTAMRLYLFSGYPWIDIPLHILGGFSVGLAVIGLLRIVYNTREAYNQAPKLLYIVIGTLFVGIAWEYVEWYYHASVAFGGDFWFDTYKDLLMDTLGGILSYICFYQNQNKTQQQIQ
jgi:uncharacterized membrane protein YjdF